MPEGEAFRIYGVGVRPKEFPVGMGAVQDRPEVADEGSAAGSEGTPGLSAPGAMSPKMLAALIVVSVGMVVALIGGTLREGWNSRGGPDAPAGPAPSTTHQPVDATSPSPAHSPASAPPPGPAPAPGPAAPPPPPPAPVAQNPAPAPQTEQYVPPAPAPAPVEVAPAPAPVPAPAPEPAPAPAPPPALPDILAPILPFLVPPPPPPPAP
ncbi:hypothetical protein ACFROC_08085 [Nocardia tengchongensis]|uniref:hypothetical protein n=1 Tax=Nocardia tengchongensis TaxID=2055889 RepID=UPI0036C020BE